MLLIIDTVIFRESSCMRPRHVELTRKATRIKKYQHIEIVESRIFYQLRTRTLIYRIKYLYLAKGKHQ